MASLRGTQVLWCTKNIMKSFSRPLRNAIQRAAGVLEMQVFICEHPCAEYQDRTFLGDRTTEDVGQPVCVVTDSRRRAKHCLQMLRHAEALKVHHTVVVDHISPFVGHAMVSLGSHCEPFRLETVRACMDPEELVSRVMFKLRSLCNGEASRIQQGPALHEIDEEPDEGSNMEAAAKGSVGSEVLRAWSREVSFDEICGATPTGIKAVACTGGAGSTLSSVFTGFHFLGTEELHFLRTEEAHAVEVDEVEVRGEECGSVAELLPASRFWDSSRARTSQRHLQ